MLCKQKRVYCHMQRMGGINNFVMSSDDRVIVSVGQEKKIVVWDSSQPEPVFSLFLDEEERGGAGDEAEGLAIAMTSDDRFLVTGDSAGVLRVWELIQSQSQQQPQHKLVRLSSQHVHSKAVTSVAFSKCNKQLVSVGEDGSIFVWWFYPDK